VVTTGFNGAAFFQSGKPDGRLARPWRIFQLQWSRFFSKRKTGSPAAPPAGD